MDAGMKRICRLCLAPESKTQFKSLLRKKRVEEVKLISGVTINANTEHIPLIACGPCFEDLERCIRFRLQVINADEYFQILNDEVQTMVQTESQIFNEKCLKSKETQNKKTAKTGAIPKQNTVEDPLKTKLRSKFKRNIEDKKDSRVIVRYSQRNGTLLKDRTNFPRKRKISNKLSESRDKEMLVIQKRMFGSDENGSIVSKTNNPEEQINTPHVVEKCFVSNGTPDQKRAKTYNFTPVAQVAVEDPLEIKRKAQLRCKFKVPECAYRKIKGETDPKIIIRRSGRNATLLMDKTNFTRKRKISNEMTGCNENCSSVSKNRTSTHASSIKTHSKSSSNISPNRYKCELCPLKFPEESVQLLHMRKTHQDDWNLQKALSSICDYMNEKLPENKLQDN